MLDMLQRWLDQLPGCVTVRICHTQRAIVETFQQKAPDQGLEYSQTEIPTERQAAAMQSMIARRY